MTRGCLYRAFDGRGQLLYIGATTTPGRRLTQHHHETDWWLRVARVELEHFDTHDQALVAEAQAVAAEEPLLNVQGATPRRRVETTERRRQAEQERDRRIYLRDTYEIAGVVCGNCGFQPDRLPKGQLLTASPCERCGCNQLQKSLEEAA